MFCSVHGHQKTAVGNRVKQIIAVVRPHLAETVLEAIKRAPLEAITVSEVKGYGRQKSYLDEYQDTEFSEAFLPKVEIMMWVDDSRYEETLDKVVTAARSGRIGDGKVFTMPIASFQ
ncbi:Nitrogen regulatory protein P-II [Stieleria bergensis]|uniref:Nitrogen regulatory protein P-II n=1 Tax=Stieleria bergensis TaxID=2528025 RepID=A0A517SXB0_9BACT|nr:Nitrogen regulatory protein P-II [Planctomycetes bacterium SV_7m_r]